MASITFFSEGIDFKISKPRATKNWIQKVVKKEKHKLSSLSYIFCSDEFRKEFEIAARKNIMVETAQLKMGI